MATNTAIYSQIFFKDKRSLGGDVSFYCSHLLSSKVSKRCSSRVNHAVKSQWLSSLSLLEKKQYRRFNPLSGFSMLETAGQITIESPLTVAAKNNTASYRAT